MTVMSDTESEFKPKKPVELFKSPGLLEQWDIHPNGKQFLMIKSGGTSDQNAGSRTSREINIILNWFEELKELVPVD